MKTGVIDVGGGLRGIYVAGVFDYCLDKQIKFDYGIGISAGSANLASYMGGFLRHSFINLDYVYGTLSESGGKNPLDYERMAENPMERTPPPESPAFLTETTFIRTAAIRWF